MKTYLLNSSWTQVCSIIRFLGMKLHVTQDYEGYVDQDLGVNKLECQMCHMCQLRQAFAQ
jgi:hypothetical protein